MDDLELRIECAKRDIANANRRLQIAASLKRIAAKTGQSVRAIKSSLKAAQQELDEAEVRLRTLYEAKGDWVPLSQPDRQATTPAPIAREGA